MAIRQKRTQGARPPNRPDKTAYVKTVLNLPIWSLYPRENN